MVILRQSSDGLKNGYLQVGGVRGIYYCQRHCITPFSGIIGRFSAAIRPKTILA
jgi:hypothetical protein